MLYILAHEKWFINPSDYPLRIDLMMQPKPLAFIAAVVTLTIALGLIWKKRRRQEIVPGPLDLGADPHRMCGFYGLVPAILALHLAVPLLVSGMQRNLFTVNNHLEGAWGYFLGLAEVGCALSFLYGGLTRLAAIMLAAMWAIGIFVLGLEPMLDNLHMLGFAAFFFFAGRGPLAIDCLIFPRLEPSPNLMRWAIPSLRIGLGLGLTFVAFTEKFANVPMALSFLKIYSVNFMPRIGFNMSNETFILCAGSVELLVGLCLTFGIFQRTILIIAWFPINMSLSYFNWTPTELIGHLPIYGAMAVLMVGIPPAATCRFSSAAFAKARWEFQPINRTAHDMIGARKHEFTIHQSRLLQ